MASEVKNQTRRLHLWIKNSVVSVASNEVRFDGEEQATNSDDRRFCRNVDEALLAFRADKDELVAHQESIQQQHIHAEGDDYDWMLDACPEHEEECRKSRDLMIQLNYTPVPDTQLDCDVAHREDVLLANLYEDTEEGNSIRESQVQHEDENGQQIPIQADLTCDDGEDDNFGDFQSASAVNHAGINRIFHMHYYATPNGKSFPHLRDSNSMEAALDYDTQQNPENPVNEILEVFESLITTDLVSLESKSSRRHLAESFTEDARRINCTPSPSFLQGLPNYFSVDVDFCLEELECIPWNHVPIWQSMDDVDMHIVEEHVTQRLSLLDAIQSQLNIEILEDLRELQPRIEESNQLVHDMDIHLKLASSYASRSKELMEASKGSDEDFTGLVGGLSLIHMWHQKYIYTDLYDVLHHCAELLEREQQTMNQIASFGVEKNDFQRILEAAEELRRVTTKEAEGGLSRLECLKPLQRRVVAILGTFRQRIEIVTQDYVALACLSWDYFSSEHFETLLLATLQVHQHQLDQIAEVKVDTGETTEAPPIVSEAWIACILDVLAFEASKCLPRALLDPAGDVTDSDYDTELMNLSFELKHCFGNYSMLKTISHNLETLRFDFEADKNYLPSVFHRLCSLLTDVLHCHVIITEWHNEFLLGQTYRKLLSDMKVPLWRCCEQVLLTCLKSYQSFATKKVLFQGKDSLCHWLVDLEGLHDVLQLTDQFLSLGFEFLDKEQACEAPLTSLSTTNKKSDLYDTLLDLFRKHLRSVHIEAMNSMGMMLSKETWQLVPLGAQYDDMTVKQMIRTKLNCATGLLGIQADKRRRWMNAFYDKETFSLSHLKSLRRCGNPFHYEATSTEITNGSVARTSHNTADTSVCSLYQMLDIAYDGNGSNRLATESAANELVKWTSMLLLVSKELPMVAADVAKVMQNLCDLYFVTVFRFCTGNISFEKIVLGIDGVEPYLPAKQAESHSSQKIQAMKGSAHFMGTFGRISSTTTRRNPPIISPHIEAEMCAPLASESSYIGALRNFIKNGQNSLSGVVNLDRIEKWMVDPAYRLQDDNDQVEFMCRISRILEKRQSAAWSCLFVAALVDDVCCIFGTFSTHSYLGQLLGLCLDEEKKEEHSEPPKQLLSSYAEATVQVIPTLVDVASRVATMKAIMGRRVVSDVCMLVPQWGASRLNENSNEYVDVLCGRCALLWQFLSTSGKLPSDVKNYTWERLVAAGFLAILEGFARVPYCSTEGRSLMSMDLGAFNHGISPRSIMERMDDDGFDKPPATFLVRGRQYVDTFIKVFYFPDEDMLTWMASNHRNYHRNHLLSLIAEGNGRPKNKHQEALIHSVMNLYKAGNLWDVKPDPKSQLL